MSLSPLTLKYGEFFSGPGGMALGIKMGATDSVRVEHSWAYDIDPDAVSTFNRNIAKVAKVGDVRTIPIAELEPVDLFTFGFPCNDFSVVGQQLGIQGNYGPLYSYGIQVLATHQPIAFIAENVSGLASANEGQAFRQIVQEMANAGAGYDLFPHLYRAEDFGVPQKRRRILIVGIRKDQNLIFHPPAPSHRTPVTVRQALVENPIPTDAPNSERTKQSVTVVERLKHIQPGENAFTATLPEELRLNVNGAKISQIYRRLHPDQPSYTITGSGGGGTHVYHWSENRALTNRERARLQSFPDDFIFEGSKESVRKQIGMAVPPLLARAVFEALSKCLIGAPYDHVQCNMDFGGYADLARDGQYQMVYERRSHHN